MLPFETNRACEIGARGPSRPRLAIHDPDPLQNRFQAERMNKPAPSSRGTIFALLACAGLMAAASGDIAKPVDPAAIITARLALQPGDEAALAAIAAPALNFASEAGVRELSGYLIVQPRVAPGPRLLDIAAEPSPRALDRVAPLIVKPLGEIGYVVVEVPAGVSESQLASFLMATGDYDYAEPDWTVFPTATPNDPSFGAQYHHQTMRNTLAWDLTAGSAAVKIGVVDSGFETGHSDLAGVFLPGYNSVNLQTQAQGGDISALNGHGTQCAGVIGARGNNGVGVSGVNWNVSVVPVRASESQTGSAQLSDLQSGAIWAAQQGARAVSVSYSGVNSSSNQQTGSLLRLTYNSLLVWAAGNSGANLGVDTYSEIIIVASVDSTDLLAGTSNFGALLDLCAPGVGILTTSTGNNYASVSGTSFACPNAAGALGLILSIDPAMTAVQARDYLFNNVDDIGVVGRDMFYGRGRVNSGRAVASAFRDRFPGAIPFSEMFEVETLASNRWVYRDQAAPAGGSIAPPSGTKALRLALASEIQTNAFALAGNTQDVRLTFFEQNRGAEAGEQLIVEYLSATKVWTNLTTVAAGAAPASLFTRRQIALPQGAKSNAFALRFRLSVNNADDIWFVDNVRIAVACAVDYNDDGVLNQEDLAAYIVAFLDESLPPGPSGTSAAPCPGEPAPYASVGYAADYNRDCTVNQEDLSGFITDYLLQVETPAGCLAG